MYTCTSKVPFINWIKLLHYHLYQQTFRGCLCTASNGNKRPSEAVGPKEQQSILGRAWDDQFFPYSVVKPWDFQNPSCSIPKVPAHIVKPSYVQKGYVRPAQKQKNLLSAKRIAGVRKSCRLAKTTLDYLGDQLKVGLTTDELDQLAFNFIIRNGAYPSPLLYHGYPKSVCTSVNNVTCHGIPDARPLCSGDIINVDVSVFIDGFHGDCSATFPVGDVDDAAANLINVTRSALENAISVCRHGQKINLIGETIENYVRQHGLAVVPDFCGHGIAEDFHMQPEIIHLANFDEVVMETGMIFTIEPVVSEGSDKIIVLEDGWTAMSVDGSRSAQFEHTILITDSGAEVLTNI